MSISDLFDSGFQKRNQDHFAAIVKVAMSDGVITDEERAFLDRLATRLDGLGFRSENAKYVVDKALTLIDQGVDSDTFAEEIKNMNR